MVNYTVQTMPYADNATITTALSSCDSIVNITQTIQDLYDFYQNNLTNPFSTIFYNISIINFNCTISSGKYFEQIIKFTGLASIHIQVAFASVYYDYLDTHSYSLNGFHIDREQRFTLSSITLNNTAQSDACFSSEVAHDSFCPENSTAPYCIETFNNPWMFNCSENGTTFTISSLPSTTNNEILLTTISSVLKSWQIGLICGLGVLFLLFVVVLIGHFIRRHVRSKRLTFSSEHLSDDMKLMEKSGIPQGQAFQRVPTVVQPGQYNTFAIPWIHERTGGNLNNKTYITRQPPEAYSRGTFIVHSKTSDPVLPSNIPKISSKLTYNRNAITPKVYQTIVISRPVSGTSINQLKSNTDGLEENKLDQSDTISLNQSNSSKPKKGSTPVSRQFQNSSFFDESLHDEDAWMSILAVVDAELDVLNRLENERNLNKYNC